MCDHIVAYGQICWDEQPNLVHENHFLDFWESYGWCHGNFKQTVESVMKEHLNTVFNHCPMCGERIDWAKIKENARKSRIK